MKKIENLKYNCKAHIDVYEKDKLINTIEKTNLLMKTGKLVLFESLCNPNPLYGNLNLMVFGDSDVLVDENDNLGSFGNSHVNDTNGYSLDLDNFDNVKIFWELKEPEFNGRTLKTIGLMGSNRSYNFVFNRINLDTNEYINKTPYIKISGYWQIFLN